MLIEVGSFWWFFSIFLYVCMKQSHRKCIEWGQIQWQQNWSACLCQSKLKEILSFPKNHPKYCKVFLRAALKNLSLHQVTSFNCFIEDNLLNWDSKERYLLFDDFNSCRKGIEDIPHKVHSLVLIFLQSLRPIDRISSIWEDVP